MRAAVWRVGDFNVHGISLLLIKDTVTQFTQFGGNLLANL